MKFSESLRKVAPYMNIGGMIAGCLLVGVLGGHWLDEKYGTEPWFLLGGSILGMASGFYHFFKIVLNIGKPSDGDGDDET